uniref:Brix domain-containing protein n=1 Tax=Megaselia scalaris TaxID=36166 RepID=T1GU79_MEGSC
VHQFTLARDVLTQYRKQFVNENIFKHSPLVIMNNFAGEGKHLKLMATTFQNMFPSINLATVSLHTIKRCLLFSYNPITKLVEVRHYSISVVASGLKKSVKKLVLGKIPNLSKCSDISDYILQTNNASDTEGEEDEASQVVLPQDLKSKGNMADNKSAVHLHEIGPRMTLQLMKIEDGVMTGEVLFNETVVKTEEEIERIKKMREKKKRLKEQRQRFKMKTRRKMKLKRRRKNAVSTRIINRSFQKNLKSSLTMMEEVGENPDEELFKTDMNEGRKRTRLPKNMSYAAKKRKMGEEKGNKKFSKDRNEKRGSRKDDDDERKPRFKKGNKFDRKDKFSKNKKFDRNDRKGGKKPIKSGRVTKKRNFNEIISYLKKLFLSCFGIKEQGC